MDRLVDVNAERVALNSVFEAAEECLWDLSIVIHGHIGCSDEDKILDMHLSELSLIEPLLDLVEVLMEEDWELDREVIEADIAGIIETDNAANGGETLEGKVVLVHQEGLLELAEVLGDVDCALHLA